jgi:chromosome partitioning protein
MSTKFITIANQKGGVGKTTTAINLAHGMARLGKSILVVDLDPQGQDATAFGISPEPGAFNILVSPDHLSVQSLSIWIRHAGRENLDLIPGNTATSTAQTVMNSESRPISFIRERLKPLVTGYNFVIIDTAPSVGGIQERAVWAADLVIIPTATESMSLDGVRQMSETLRILASERSWRGGLLGVLPTFYDEKTRESQAAIAELRSTFGDLLLAPIHRATILRECVAEGLTIFEKDPDSRAAQEYRELVFTVLKF